MSFQQAMVGYSLSKRKPIALWQYRVSYWQGDIKQKHLIEEKVEAASSDQMTDIFVRK